MEKLPADLKAKATAIGNGENTTVGSVTIEAIPAYNTTEDRKKYHPQGRDNGYVLTIDGSRVYIAGDTEDIPEMRALKDIAIAFVPMNLPFTMDIDQASSAVAEFKPGVVYPYHYKGSDPQAFATKVTAAAPDTKVVQGAGTAEGLLQLRPDRARRQQRARAVDEGPGRRLHARETRRVGLVDAGVVEGLRHHRRQEGQRRARPVDDGDREGHDDLAPALPAMEVAQAVGAHDPDEIDAGIFRAHQRQRVGGVAHTDGLPRRP